MANLATPAPKAAAPRTPPLINLTKAQIIQLGTSLGVDYAVTQSCYDPDSTGAACGHCDSCQLRLKGFFEAGIPDPARYR
jgi:7-cyano-7-deazaguanine synthase